eukprot:CAMPEP_0202445316 /NCGR_PEP_ID=MMETSP1360-20130828/4153_1 /ASSEMBLY_ACC=CAM_ASM_000848 /TAXON_ID=515479 /ORGANISM="Licmophora paradoxa, Strain CCMP2313" /LENGTH=497 /DNA_ID=CAMNT_0049061537 /DNA_START=327 /DNA_END=1820 /DNA_ORIENTATION=-
MTKSDLYFALDCEMVGIGPEGYDSALARVTIVNWENQIVLDAFVKVPVPVTDYRTYVSGITPQDIESERAVTFEEARSLVEDILRGKILIGHGLDNDLCALNLTHPFCDVRDTATYPPYMREIAPTEATGYEINMPDSKSTAYPNFRPRKLRDLAWEQLGRQIQHEGVPHSPVEDAIAALDLYKAQREGWELALSRHQQQQQKREEQQQRSAAAAAYHHPHHVTAMLSYHSAIPPAAAIGPTAAVYPPSYSPFTPTFPGYNVGYSPAAPPPPAPREPAVRQSSWRWIRRPRSPGGGVDRSKSPPPTVAASLEEERPDDDDLASLRSNLSSNHNNNNNNNSSSNGPPFVPQLSSSNSYLWPQPRLHNSNYQQQQQQQDQPPAHHHHHQRPVSPRSRWFFRRNVAPPPSNTTTITTTTTTTNTTTNAAVANSNTIYSSSFPMLRQVSTFETDTNTVCTECESNLAVEEIRSRTASWAASDQYGEGGEIAEEPWQPQYNF